MVVWYVASRSPLPLKKTNTTAALALKKKREEKTAHLPRTQPTIHSPGRVKCLDGTMIVPLSPPYPANGVASKDVILDLSASISARLYLPSATVNQYDVPHCCLCDLPARPGACEEI
jgi:hypothetical protein